MSARLRERPLLGLGVAAAVVIADQVTKWISVTRFAEDPVTVVPGWLWFTFTENPGAAFSFFQGAGPVLGVVAAVAAVVIILALRYPRPRWEAVAFGLILGGALGNLTDRILRGDGLLDGHVVDWIRVPDFPVFNVADSAVTVAVVLLLVLAWKQPAGEPTPADGVTSTGR